MAEVFSVQIDRIAERFEKGLDRIFQKVCLDISRGVIMGTPVDTGRARANWQAEIDGIPSDKLDRTDPNGGATLAAVREPIGRLEAGHVFYLANNLDYIVPLEYGHSKQAPSGMVRITLARFQNLVGDAVRSVR